jgi:hypothetical protein
MGILYGSRVLGGAENLLLRVVIVVRYRSFPRAVDPEAIRASVRSGGTEFVTV